MQNEEFEESISHDDLIKVNTKNFVTKCKEIRCFISVIQLPFTLAVINNFQSYVTENHKLLLTFLESICTYLSKDQCKFNIAKESYDLLKIEYEAFLNYVKDGLETYFYSQNEKFKLTDNEDGALSPSNPFFSNFNEEDENKLEESLAIDKIMYDIKESEIKFEGVFKKTRRKTYRILQKRKQQWKRNKNEKKRNKKIKKKNKTEHLGTFFNEFQCSSENFEESLDPYDMMGHFFKQYLRSGRWKWAEWNDYIRKILNLHPEWFNKFSQIISEMGIDFKQMFRSDLEAAEMANVRIDPKVIDKEMDLSTQSREGKSIIFNESEEIVEKKIDDLFCSSCNRAFNSERTWNIHLRGVIHIQNELNRVIKDNPLKLSDIYDENLKEPIKNSLNQINTEENITVTCSVNGCNFVFPNESDLLYHKKMIHDAENGYYEVKTVEKLKSLTEGENVKNFPDSVNECSNLSVIPKIQNILNQCIQPLVGLNYLVEYQYLNVSTECKYVCELCGYVFVKQNVIPHFVSYRHRKNYLKNNYSILFKLLEGDRGANAVKLKRVEIYCEEIEHTEGRGKLSVMQEKSKKELSEECLNKQQMQSIYAETEDGEITSEDEENVENIEAIVSSPSVKIKDELEAGEISSDNDSNSDDIDNVEELKGKGMKEFDKSKFMNFTCISQSNVGLTESLEHRNNLELKKYLRSRNFKNNKVVTEKLIDQFKFEVRLGLGKINNVKVTRTDNKGNQKSMKSKKTLLPDPDSQEEKAKEYAQNMRKELYLKEQSENKIESSYDPLASSERLSRHATFLGLDQPPPIVLPQMVRVSLPPPSHIPTATTTLPLPPTHVPPHHMFYTPTYPGMIEHHNSTICRSTRFMFPRHSYPTRFHCVPRSYIQRFDRLSFS